MEIVGIHLEHLHAYISVVSKRGKKILISSNKKIKILPENPQDTFQNLLKTLQKEGFQKKFETATGLGTGLVLIKNIEIPIQSIEAVYKALPFQLEVQIPYPLQEAVVLTSCQKKGRSTVVKNFSTHEEHLNEHLARMKEYGIDPDYVGCDSQGLFRYMQTFFPFEKGCIFHLSDEKLRIVLVFEGELVGAHELDFGISTFINALNTDLPHHSESRLRSLLCETNLFEKSQDLYPHLQESLSQFFKELDRIVFYASTKNKLTFVFDVLILGECGLLSDLLKSFLQQYVDYSFNLISQEIDSSHRQFEIPIGLAIDVLEGSSSSLQFRQKTFVNPQSIKKTIKKLIFAGCTGFLFIAVSYFLTAKLLDRKENELSCQIDQFIDIHQDQIPNYHEKMAKLDSSIISKLKFLKRSFGRKQKTSEYFKNPPHVYEAIQEVIRRLESFPGGYLSKIDFNLTQFPTLENPQNAYEGQVALWVKSSSQDAVKLFCEELLKSEVFSKNGHELLQLETSNEYKITFCILNKS